MAAAASVKKKKSFARSSKPVVRMCVLDREEHTSMACSEPVWPIPMRAIGAQNLLTMPGGVTTAGYLHKKGGSQFSLMKWPLRFIIIHKGCVYYFKSSTSPSPQGAFSLNGYNRVMRAAEETTSSNVFPFKIVHFSKKHRTWLFSAASEEERRSWMRQLRREIDHYNDRQESHIPSSDTDSDTDSFYGSIERPMDIRHPVENPDDDYVEEDDEEDEEDYLKPDSSPTYTGRPTGPPPSYPPPPVPALSNKLLPQSKAPPPPPPIHRIPTSPLPKKLPPPSVPVHQAPSPPTFPIHKVLPPPAIPVHKGLPSPSVPIHKGLSPPTIPNHRGPSPTTIPNHRGPSPTTIPNHRGPSPTTVLTQTPSQKGPPPDVPFASYQQKHAPFSQMTPPLPPPNPRRTDCQERPLHAVLESQLRLNRPAPSPARSHSPSHNHSPSHSPTHTLSQSSAHNCSPTHTLAPGPAHVSSLGNRCSVQPPAAKPGLALSGPKPKPLPPTCKPPVPTSKKPPATAPLGRASPEGQSFRSSAEELPADLRSRWDSAKLHRDRSDDDDDYENVQLPDSVFIDSTETSFVEKLFRDSEDCPDGLYAIRNSGTRTAKVLVVWDISVSRARNYRLFEEDGCIFLDRELTFPSLAILIEHYYSHALPQQDALYLQKPYTRIC